MKDKQIVEKNMTRFGSENWEKRYLYPRRTPESTPATASNHEVLIYFNVQKRLILSSQINYSAKFQYELFAEVKGMEKAYSNRGVVNGGELSQCSPLGQANSNKLWDGYFINSVVDRTED